MDSHKSAYRTFPCCIHLCRTYKYHPIINLFANTSLGSAMSCDCNSYIVVVGFSIQTTPDRRQGDGATSEIADGNVTIFVWEILIVLSVSSYFRNCDYFRRLKC